MVLVRWSVIPEPPPGLDEDPEPLVLQAGEIVAHRWGAPKGRGVLTNQRLVLLSHPEPVHRVVRWSVALEAIVALAVDEVTTWHGRETFFSGDEADEAPVSTDGLGLAFEVNVNRVTVYLGNSSPCADLQLRIDRAREARCLALYGRLVPYRPGEATPETDPDNPYPERSEEAAAAFALAPPAPAASDFLLFLAGEPFKDIPDLEGRQLAVGVLPGLRVERIGGHTSADLQPGQVYGAEGETGRMVLSLAAKCGVTVRVIDVDRPGPEAELVGRWVSAEDPLPLLVRPDGARLEGDEAFQPARVAEFLQGR